MDKLTPEEEARKRIIWWNDRIVVLTREGFLAYMNEYKQTAQAFMEMLNQSGQLAKTMQRAADLYELEKIFDCVEKQKANLN